MAAQTELILQTVVKWTETATKALNDVKGSLDSIGKSASKLGGAFSGIKDYFKSATDASKQLWIALIGVGTAAAYGFTKLSDNATSMTNTLKQVTKSEEDLVKLQKELLDVANRSRVPVDSLTKSFVRFDKVNTAIWGNQKQTTQMLENLSKWLSLSGATAEETWSAMLQLSQAFWSGKLAGDEFRSVSENFPMLLDILAKSMSVPRGELKELAKDWKITSQVLKTALLWATNQINTAFEKSSVSVSSAMQILKNNALIAFIELDKQYGITQKVVQWIGMLWQSFWQMMPYLTTFAAWFTENKEVILWVIVWALTPAIISLATAIGWALLTLSPFMLIGALIAKNWWTIVPIFNSIVEWVKSTAWSITKFVTDWKTNNDELIKSISWTFNKIKEIFSLVFGIIKAIISNDLAIIKAIWSAWWDEIKAVTSYIFNAVFEAVKIIFSNGLDIIIGLLKVFKWIFTGDWNLVWEWVKQAVEAWVTMVRELFVWLFNGIQTLIEPFIQKAKEWWSNMIQMFIDWIKEKYESLKASVSEIATTISDYLGFHSPTKKWPASDSDTWMPNFVKMLVDGLKKWVDPVSRVATEIANKMKVMGQKINLDSLKEALSLVAQKAKDAMSSLTSKMDESASKVKALKDEIAWLNTKLKDLTSQRATAGQEWVTGIAWRAVDIQKEIDWLKSQTDITESERIQKLNALTQELALAKTIVSEEDIKQALLESQKSTTQKMIEAMKLKIIEIDTEIFKTKQLLSEKQAMLIAEENAYKKMNDTRIQLENAYYSLFNQNITKIQDSIQASIRMMQRLASMGWPASSSWIGTFPVAWARASGWPVSWKSSYLVGEKWPEIFTPGTSWQIIPNHKIGWAGSSIVINITGIFWSDAVGEISDAIVTNLKRASYI